MRVRAAYSAAYRSGAAQPAAATPLRIRSIGGTPTDERDEHAPRDERQENERPNPPPAARAVLHAFTHGTVTRSAAG